MPDSNCYVSAREKSLLRLMTARVPNDVNRCVVPLAAQYPSTEPVEGYRFQVAWHWQRTERDSGGSGTCRCLGWTRRFVVVPRVLVPAQWGCCHD